MKMEPEYALQFGKFPYDLVTGWILVTQGDHGFYAAPLAKLRADTDYLLLRLVAAVTSLTANSIEFLIRFRLPT